MSRQMELQARMPGGWGEDDQLAYDRDRYTQAVQSLVKSAHELVAHCRAKGLMPSADMVLAWLDKELQRETNERDKAFAACRRRRCKQAADYRDMVEALDADNQGA